MIKRGEVDINTVYSVAMSTPKRNMFILTLTFYHPLKKKSMCNLKKKTCVTFGDGLRIPCVHVFFIIGEPAEINETSLAVFVLVLTLYFL